MREIIDLACEGCKRINYTTMKNKKNTTGRVRFNKYCKWCKKHVFHKEEK